MDILLSDEQKLLQESAATFIARHAGPGLARSRRDRAVGFDDATWQEIAKAGWLDVVVAEAAGGPGLGSTELALILEQAGRGLLNEPVGAVNAAARTLADSDSGALREQLLPAIVAGDHVVVPALQEGLRGVDLDAVATRVTDDGSGLRLSGEKLCIPGTAGADGYLINAVGPTGQLLCYVPVADDGVSRAETRLVDGDTLARVRFDDVAVPPDHVIAGPNGAASLAASLHDLILIGLGAELLGVMGQALDMALDYIKIRNQFDRPIGSFQALQHRAVDDYIEVELTRSLLFQVCASADEGRATSAMASAVKAKASNAALAVTKSAIQLHGAIGFTDEHDIGLYLKRAMALSAQYGNEAAHRRRYARLVGAD